MRAAGLSRALLSRTLVSKALLSTAVCLAACATPASDLPDWMDQTGVEGVTGTVGIIPDFASAHITPRDLHIWLPPSYAGSTRRYPVVYVHDGQNAFDPAQSKYSQTDWGLDEAMMKLLEDGEVREAIIVGIASIEDERFENYMPEGVLTPEVLDALRSDFAMKGWPLGTINSDAYLRFVVQEVKPFIDAEFRTLRGPDDTSMMGASMGGLITTYALLEYPEVFGQGAGVSTHLPIAGGVLVDYFGDRLEDMQGRRMYYDYGTETLDADYEPYQLRLDARFRDAGWTASRDYRSRKYPGHSHTEVDWRKRVHAPLQFMIGAPE